MSGLLKKKESGLAARVREETNPGKGRWAARSGRFRGLSSESPAAAGGVCPFCGQPVRAGAAVCLHCGRALVPGKCSFCGAAMKPSARFCTQCGQPREGLLCPVCGTLNARNFCRKCNAPLTEMARQAVAAAQEDPAFRLVQAKAAELAVLHDRIEKLRKTDGRSESSPELSETDRALLDEYARVLQSVGASAPVQPPVQEKETEARVQYADAVLSLDEIMTAYREKVAEMNAALSAMVPPPGFVPEQQRDYYSARRVASVHTEYDLSGYQPTVWKCNLCGALHNCPSECAEPQLGGTWVYVTPEQYIEENGDFIVKQRTLMIE